jgi:hypothetical protein
MNRPPFSFVGLDGEVRSISPAPPADSESEVDSREEPNGDDVGPSRLPEAQ